MAKKTQKAGPNPPRETIPRPSPPETTQPPTHSSTASVTSSPSFGSLLRSSNARKALQLAVLAALYSPVSQLNLSPVYGSIPSALYHRWGVGAAILLSFGLRGLLPPWISNIIPVYCFWIPTLQFFLFKYSSTFGNPLGPLITELLTYYPLVTLSISTGIQLFDDVRGPQTEASFSDAAPALGLYFMFNIVQRGAKNFFPTIMGSAIFNTRVGMQIVLATLYSLILVPSGSNFSLFWPSIPSVAFTILGNPHSPLIRTTEVLNNTLAMYDYTLLARYESITGYISVLEDNQKGFRVMRCDHSLLGGEWKMTNKDSQPGQIAEPIYAIFTMLEAVRLVETPLSKVADNQKKALVIGLGIGTAPSALIAHGINTTVVELDPVVHQYAGQYFNFPHNHSIWLGDAVAAVSITANEILQSETQSTTNKTKLEKHFNQRDFIIHDVFTGGAEPVELFTKEFLQDLHTLLNPKGGVIAINYAGDLSNPTSASLIYRTVISVFGQENCRVFREDAESEENSNQDQDFTNMVFFCIRSDDPNFNSKGVKFRSPKESDFLKSDARRQFLLPRHEIPSTKFLTSSFKPSEEILTTVNTKILTKHQIKSSIGHWKLMRTVLPDGVWENW